jgi:spore coat protein U-like protein
MNSLSIALAASIVAQPLIMTSALAATATSNMNVRITIEAACKVQSAADLDFGTKGVLDAASDQASTITIQCTTGTPYNVGLSAGSGAGATVATRRMTAPGPSTVDYSIYRDAARTQVWGVTIGTDTVAGTGNGAAQALTAYGRVPAQTTPAPGAYSDIVTVTVTY